MSERTTYLMKTWRDRALAAEAERDEALEAARAVKVDLIRQATEAITAERDEARAERDARVRVLDCNAADLHDDPHVWDFGSGEHFVCFGSLKR